MGNRNEDKREFYTKPVGPAFEKATTPPPQPQSPARAISPGELPLNRIKAGYAQETKILQVVKGVSEWTEMDDSGFVQVAGDTMTGNLAIQGALSLYNYAAEAQPTIILNPNGDGLQLGAGGASAPDWQLFRSSIGVAALTAGDKLQMSTAPTVGDDLTNKTYVDAVTTALNAHISDTSAAHAAASVSADSTTLVGTGTDVQAVLEELDNGIADHLADTSAAHAATAISNTPAGNIAATTVQAAIDELDTEKASATAVHCCAYRSAALTHSGTGTYTLIPLDAEEDDTNTMHDNTTNPSRIVAPTAGVYLITVQVRFAASATGIIGVAVLKNNAGAAYNGANSLFATGDDNDAGSGQYAVSSKTVRLAANDYIEAYGFQNSGGNLAYTTGTTQTWMSLTRIGS